MASQVETGEEPAGRDQCWCCGTYAEHDRMVHLGNHPEVALCLACARWTAKRAWEIEDSGRAGTAARVRGHLRAARAGVIRRGWHRNRVLSAPLKWLGRRLP